MQYTKLTGQIAERKRNALEAAWLGQLTQINEMGVSLNTTDDLYNYLLIDTQSGWQLTTSVVAQVIASLQQYINNILFGHEPGYTTVSWMNHQPLIDDWQSTTAQYDTWAANVLLAQYPENYLSPPLRTDQTHNFAQMVSDLNQGPLNDDTILTAVQGYLNRFEEVANLSVISGYIAGTNLARSDYYFLGCTASKPYTYYWRKCAMQMNTVTTMVPDSWSEWQKVGLPLGGDNVVGLPRPVIHNKRLYVVWFERQITAKQGDGNQKQVTLTAQMAYQKFDGSWSTPQSCGSATDSQNLESDQASIFGKEDTRFSTLALVLTHITAQPFLYAALYTDINSKDAIAWPTSDRGEEGNLTLINKKRNAMVCTFDAWMNLVESDLKIVTNANKTNQLFKWYSANQLAKDTYNTSVVNQSARNQQFLQRAVNIVGISQGEGTFTGQEKISYKLTIELEKVTLAISCAYSAATLYFYKKKSLAVLKVRFDKQGVLLPPYNYQSDLIEIACSGKLKVIGIVVKINAATTCGSFSLSLVNELESKDKIAGGPNAYNIYKKYKFSSDLTADSFLDLDLNVGTDPMPILDSYTDLALGTTQFAHFDFKNTGDSTLTTTKFVPSNIRLNTLFARQLVNSAQEGLDHLLQWNTQLTQEPDMGPGFFTKLTLPSYDSSIHGPERWFRVGLSNIGRNTALYPVCNGTLSETETSVTVFVPYADGLYENERCHVYAEFSSGALTGTWEPAFFYFDKQTQQVVLINDTDHDSVQTLNETVNNVRKYQGFRKITLFDKNTTPMDFSDANGLYFWELFYHTPAMVAYTLQSRGQHANARLWQQRIFNPSAINQGTDSQGKAIEPYWKVVPISPQYAKENPSYAIEGPTDPDALAYTNPEHFRKASYMAYVQAQIALGDMYYRQLTPDSLNQALQIYTQTCGLLGARPDADLANAWTPITLKDTTKNNMTEFEMQLTSLPEYWISYPTSSAKNLLQNISAKFHSPANTQLLALWDTLDARRYNLRHNLDINGNSLQLPLFAAPLDPTEIFVSEAQGGTRMEGRDTNILSIPPYRYRVMNEKAREAVGMLRGFGQQLLQYLEANDERHKKILGQSQLADLYSFTQRAQQQAVDISNNGMNTLKSSLEAAKQRHDHYQGLFDGGISSLESASMRTMAASAALMTTLPSITIATGALKLIPNIFGMADGGSDYSGPLTGIGEGIVGLGTAMGSASQAMSMQAEFERRKEEWQQQSEQASHDIIILQSQIKGQQLQIEAAKTAQDLSVAQHQQVMEMYKFLSTRFTSESLYRWLIGQLSALYYQAYDATLNLCFSAQACWQYELGDFNTTFIQAGSWNDHYHGLLAGETLQLNLQQMEVAWLSRNTRNLNITRTVPLREKLGKDVWQKSLLSGSFIFKLTEQDFDLDYPGHYLRQIANVSVTLPAIIGPYQNIRATLTQTSSSLILKPDIEAVKYLKNQNSGRGESVKRNLNASQKIALSGGLDDSGVFVLNTGDDRYLPFEGTGAVSEWVLDLPNHTSPTQQQILDSLEDIIVTVRYTARDGGKAFADQVSEVWKEKVE
ncbi:neuraminidase-like domain-containing protein [Xenorhabdus indica]|uniref:Tc toxin subunit A-related protein n=1 Tax=Xenorhabdus indica TaxID=333964 RepID=UPI001FEA7BD6|nr:neuraminidase-like domain-containing protein [Xenorhabdus indica]MBC8947237.1 A component of insecticidal toxin complex [Xenorhabdus indica]